MNMRSTPRITRASLIWLHQIFSTHAAPSGGVVRRKARDVDRMIGRALLERPAQQRGFHMVLIGDQDVIPCDHGDLTRIC